MKRIHFFIVPLLCLTCLIYPTTKDTQELDPHNATYNSTLKKLETIQAAGGIDNAFAIMDFYRSIENPEYEITSSNSQEILKMASLLTDDYIIPEDIRYAFAIIKNR